MKAAGFTNTKELPLGVVVAVAEVHHVFSTDGVGSTIRVTEQERAFGNYDPHRFGWMFRNVRPLKTPVPAAYIDGGVVKPGGALGLWSVPQVLLDLIAGQGVL